jgi:hypothetical protein
MATELKRRIDILAELSYAELQERVDKTLAEFVKVYNISIPLAFAVSYGNAILTDKGASEMNATFDKLLELAGVEDTGFQELGDILNPDE